MSEYTPFRIAGVSYPVELRASTGKPSLQDVGPIRYEVLEFAAGVLALDLGARYAEEAASCGLTQAPNVVGSKLPYDPAPFMQKTGFTFPLLCVFPLSADMTEHSRMKERITRALSIMYVLPPLTAAQAEHMTCMLDAVGDIIAMRVGHGYHPDHDSGRNVFADINCDRVRVESMSYGVMSFPTSSGVVDKSTNFYPTVSMSLSVSAVRQDVNFETGLEGIDAKIAVKDGSGQTDVVEFHQELSP